MNVKIFRPYKYNYKKAVRQALQRLEPEYTVVSFLRDLNDIREETFRPEIIRHAFRDSGMWPIQVKKALTQLKLYTIPDRPQEPTLPTLPSTPKTVRHSIQAIEELEDRIPGVFSSPSAQHFLSTLRGTKYTLESVDLTRAEQAVTISAWKYLSEAKARSRKRVTRSKDGKSLFNLRELIGIKQREEEEALKK